MQKRIIRIITCSKYNVHTSPLFKSLRILTLDDMSGLNTLKFYYKYLDNELPTYFYSLKRIQKDIQCIPLFHDLTLKKRGTVHTSHLMMIIRQYIYMWKYIYVFSQSSQREWVNWKHTASHAVKRITGRICLILLTHSTNYTWQAFYKFDVFRKSLHNDDNEMVWNNLGQLRGPTFGWVTPALTSGTLRWLIVMHAQQGRVILLFIGFHTWQNVFGVNFLIRLIQWEVKNVLVWWCLVVIDPGVRGTYVRLRFVSWAMILTFLLIV